MRVRSSRVPEKDDGRYTVLLHPKPHDGRSPCESQNRRARPGLIIMALMEESIVTVIITCKLHLVGLKKASHVVVSWR